ncbi:unnamed protein product [Thelazia callipaeda]|uniref:ILEI domain-containing protein n=1 Tax=Thelazia callipaeda TaxID=103827 RepID=A0A0N5CQH7_THECL|nr:unnamed protein product [Thelazia callipaeda]
MLRLYWLKRLPLIVIVLTLLIVLIREINHSQYNTDFATHERDHGDSQFISSIDSECFQNVLCPEGGKTILLRAESRIGAPLACFNNKRLFDNSKLVKGFNIAVLNYETGDVSGIHYLKIQEDDSSVSKLLTHLRNEDVIVGTSYGDVAANILVTYNFDFAFKFRISSKTRKIMLSFGLSLMQYKTLTSIVFVGRLNQSAAFEKVITFKGKLANATVNISEPQDNSKQIAAKLSPPKSQELEIMLGSEWVNCGYSKNCSQVSDEIVMFFYSGIRNSGSPQICINGRFIIDRNLNSAGRGLNLVVIDPKTHQVVRTGNYDTYLQGMDCFNIDLLWLSDMAKHIFYELGSSLIYHLKFRASWYFIGQKGIGGYTPFEDLNLAPGNDWAKPVQVTVCVPSVLDGLKTTDNHFSKTQNMLRRHFCSRYNGYGEFCDESRLDLPLTPRKNHTQMSATDPVYSVPILLAGGLNMNNIRLCLESIFYQGGVNLEHVVVAFDSFYNEISDLSAVFHVRALPINNVASYQDFVLKAIDRVLMLFPSALCIIVIEEDIVLLPGFLYFVAQLLPQFLRDDTANFILTFNENGLGRRSLYASSAYRVENVIPTGAYVVKKLFYSEYVANPECCKGMEFNWGISYLADVSRVKPVNVFDISSFAEYANTSEEQLPGYADFLNGDEKVDNANRLDEGKYDIDLKAVITTGHKFHVKETFDCNDNEFVARSKDYSNHKTSFSVAVNASRS